MANLLSRFIKTDIRVLLGIGLFVIAAYSPMLASPFKTLDDDYSIVRNSDIRSLSHVPGVFTKTYFGGKQDYYRPFVYVSYAVEYKLFRLSPFFYNLDNALIHVLNAFLVFLVVGLLLSSRAQAAAVAFVFAIHPIHWEAVSNISGRAILLCAFFVLAGWYFFLRFVRENRLGFLWAATACYALGLLCKESAGVFILAAGLYWIMAVRKPVRSVVVLWPLAVVAGGYFVIRHVMKIVSVFPWPSPGSMAMGVVSFLRGVLTYLRLFLFPTDLYFDRARRVFVSPHEFGFIATLAIYAGIGVLIWRKWRALTPLARFCLVWFWIELLPVSQIVTSIGVYPGAISVAEHFVYMACIPAFILLALGLEQGIAWLKARRLVSTLILALAGVGMTVFLLVMLLGRATCASSEFAMLHESLAHDPHNSRLQYSLGRLFADTGYKDLAVEAFRRSVKLHNCNPNYHMALGVALADRGDNLEAVRIWEAMPARDDISKAILDRKKSAYAALVKEYEAKHAAAPNDPQVLFALGVFQAKLGDQDKALASFEAAWAADSTRFDALFNVAVTAEGLGNWPKARTAYTELAARAAVDNAFHRMAVERLSRPEPVQKN